MKTTVDLPDELMRSLKIRAVNEGRRLKDVMADMIVRGLAVAPEPLPAGVRVRLPLIECARPARPDEEMTPERVAAVLVQADADAVAPP